MALTKEAVYQLEHKLIEGQCIWECADDENENWRTAVLYSIAGINEMTQAVIEAMDKV